MPKSTTGAEHLASAKALNLAVSPRHCVEISHCLRYQSTEAARRVTNRMSVEDVKALSKHLGLAGQAGGLSSVETDFLVVAWLKKRGFVKPGELPE